MGKNKEKAMSLIEHLKELRRRLIRGFFVTLIVFFGCYFFRENLLIFLKHPLEEPLQKYSSLQQETISQSTNEQNLLDCVCQQPKGKQVFKDSPVELQKLMLDCSCQLQKKVQQKKKTPLIFIGLPEIFFTELKISFFLALFFSFPYWLLELLGFVLPALYKKEKNIFLFFVPTSFLFFVGGAIFGYLVVFPIGFDFFLSLTKPEEVIPSLSIGQYTSFATKLLFAFGVVFEFPLVIFLLSRMGFISPKFMIKNTKYAVILICIFSAILTPPDPFTMLLMAAPLTLLYIFSIFLCFLSFNRKQAKLKKEGLL